MTWSNLYSTESNYKISVNFSIWRQGFLLASLAVFILAFQYNHFADINWYSYAILLLVASFFTYKYSCKQHPQLVFEIDLNGRCQFSVGDLWLVQPHSFVLPWGACLLLKQQQKNAEGKNLKKFLFIFKDSCIAIDYCRLARVINKVRANPASNKLNGQELK